MIFQWVDHPALDRVDQLINVIYDLGMATREQLQTVTGWNDIFLKDIMQRLRGRAKKNNQEVTDWIKVRYLPGRGRKAVYTLGRTAIEHVHNIRNINSRIKEAPSGQVFHYVGKNDVLKRAIQHFGRDQVEWYSEHELADMLWLQSKEHGLIDENNGNERRSLIRPDGKLIIIDQNMRRHDYHIEFDNNTESPRQLEKKYNDYIRLYDQLKIDIPIIWVTISEKRRAYLESNWRATLEVNFPHKKDPPKSLFAVREGEIQLITDDINAIKRPQ